MKQKRRATVCAQKNDTIALTEKSTAFADTVDSFVRQFLKLPAAARVKSRLV
jgi:hypothetical protein